MKSQNGTRCLLSFQFLSKSSSFYAVFACQESFTSMLNVVSCSPLMKIVWESMLSFSANRSMLKEISILLCKLHLTPCKEYEVQNTFQ